ncbi:MAG: hypothetical protein O3B73_08725 [bacterium]|nr:hypothetical protein [bacterium]
MELSFGRIIFFTRQMDKMKAFNRPDSRLHLCDGKDPEGNTFQISNRVKKLPLSPEA